MISGRVVNDFDGIHFHTFNISGDVQVNMDLYNLVKPDLILEVDCGGTTINGRDFLKRVSCPTAYFNFDAFNDMGRMYMGYISHFDYVFNIDSWLIKDLKPKKKAYFLPIGLMNAMTFPIREKIYDVIFFGSVAPHVYGQSRLPYIEAFKKAFGEKFYFSEHIGYSHHNLSEYACRMAESKVAINLGFADHLSLRPFEAMGARCYVVTTPLTDIANVETMSERLTVVTSPEEMIAKTQSILENPNPDLLEANYKWMYEKHTIQQRIETIISTLKTDGCI